MNFIRLKKYKPIFILFTFWVIILSVFQIIVVSRFQVKGPDYSLPWTVKYTKEIGSFETKPFLKRLIDTKFAYDSTYYYSIARYGYDDINVASTRTPENQVISANYAFYPVFPLLVRIVSFILSPIIPFDFSRFIFSGVIINIISSLIGSISLYEISKIFSNKNTSLQTVYFFLIFPTSFFLLQFYTEGLFIGLTFLSILLIYKEKYYLSIPFISLAILTRPNGIALLIFLISEYLYKKYRNNRSFYKNFRKAEIINFFEIIIIPVAIFMIINFSNFGKNFHYVESQIFSRNILNLSILAKTFTGTISSILSGNLHATVFFILETSGISLSIVSIILFFKKSPSLSLFCSFSLIMGLTSGPFQSNIRYILSLPIIYLFLSDVSTKHVLFEKIWSIVSILLLGFLLTLFSFNFWVG